ncbi:DUF1961 family protein [Auraticoccus sp. F435]|uniref:DUF1961 family protein n=1 Tax=Auraticoccus cholistanensis TaxID=2656650 RepID=A0A6A9V0D5_9ACTN|nr:DUF1961 family protein [Auraticoccus cholistanensis]MVA75399.1 DUF1961 family protein [Auraticoccus cholistanensis]
MTSYSNPLDGPEALRGFRMEGDGRMTFPRGRLRLESGRSAEEGQNANIVLWCPEELGPDVEISWSFWPLVEPGLAILFFAARGHGDRDVLDPSLAPRTGPYEQYHSSDLDTYHLSYFRRRWPDERRFHTCNLRRSSGFHLVAQGADPIPGVADADGPYRLRLRLEGARTRFDVDGLTVLDWTDDGTYGPPLRGGKIGFRQMAPLVAEYADLVVRPL